MSFFKGAARTKRKLSNENTGLDMFVEEYDTSTGDGGQTLYHIIIVSTLPFFKSPQKHKPEDVVQFSVARRYKEFEALQEQLSQEFPSALFPDLPPWRLICTQDDLEDRQIAFDSMVRVIAKTKRLCRCRSVLRFLGLSAKQIDVSLQTLSAGEKAKSSAQAAEEKEDVDDEPAQDLFLSDEKDTTEEDIIAAEELEKVDISVRSRDREDGFDAEEEENSAFHRAFLAAGTSGNTTTDGDSGRQLAAPGAATSESLLLPKETATASSDLFSVEDDLDKLLKVTKKPAKTRTKAKPKQLLDDDDLFAAGTDAGLDLTRMGADDFSRYIQSNTQGDDVDLFT